MSEKIKRYISLDVLRGLAIIGVISFHVLTRAFDKNYAIDHIDERSIIFYIILVPLFFIGEMDVLFTSLSAAVNTISIDKKWNKIMQEYAGNPTEGKKKAFWTILKTQLIGKIFPIFRIGTVMK